MEVYNATVIKENEKVFLVFDLITEQLRIPITEDLPNDVKNVFNKLITKLKAGEISFNLMNPGTDLYSQVSIEYIDQLNSELSNVYKELVHHGLLSKG